MQKLFDDFQVTTHRSSFVEIIPVIPFLVVPNLCNINLTQHLFSCPIVILYYVNGICGMRIDYQMLVILTCYNCT